MEPSEVISISDTEESNGSSIVLLRLPQAQNEHQNKPNMTDTRRQSSVSQNNEEVDVLTLSSVSHRSTERCPVTWCGSAKKSKFHFLNSDTYFSPSPKSKVTHWLSENVGKYSNSSLLEQQRVVVEPNLKESLLDSFSTNKSSILVRQDYKKLPSVEDHFINQNVHNVNMGSNRIIYLENSDDRTSEICNMIVGEHMLSNRDNSNLVQKSNKSVAIGNSQQPFDPEQSDVDIEESSISTPLSVTSLVKSMPGLCPKSDQKSKTKSTNIPLSPESQKKIELCDYLKLMNMNASDTISIGMRQNRRSTRVKHLAVLSEKRELERKLNTDMSEPEKKKSLKVSDSDSRHSSLDNDGGSKASSNKSNLSTLSSSTSKTTSRNISPSQKHTEENKRSIKSPQRRNSIKTPSKHLQVPEVSTTSFSKLKNSNHNHNFSNASVYNRKSDNSQMQHKKNGSNSSIKSEAITKKSFEQLHINVETLKPLIHMLSTDSIHESTNSRTSPNKVLNFSLAKSAKNIPNTISDFEESIKMVLGSEILVTGSENNKETPKQTRMKTRYSDDTKKSNKKMKLIPKSTSAQKRKFSDSSPRSKTRNLNGASRKTSKKKKNVKKKFNNNLNRPSTRLAEKLEIRKKYNNLKHINRLRSSGRLKQVGIKTILLKTKSKQKSVLRFLKEKDFKTTELIQHGPESNSGIAKELTIKQSENSKISPSKFSPSRTKKHLPEAEVWKKYFTSEHRKAYIESIKYVEDAENTWKNSPSSAKKDTNKEMQHNLTIEQETTSKNIAPIRPCSSFKISETNNTEAISKASDTCENIETCIKPTPYASPVNNHRPSSEDLEVDQLMSCKRVKHQATQKDCESPEAVRSGTLQTDLTDPVLADHSRCTSSSDQPSTNSWSLQTVETNPEPTTSSRQDIIEVPCSSPKVQTSETPNSAGESDTHPDENDDTFSGLVGQPEVVNISQIQPTTCKYVHLPSNGTEIKSLHHCLTQPKTKLRDNSRDNSPTNRQNWEESFGTDKSPKSERKSSQSHTIYLSNNNGAVMNAYYLDYNLIIVQELMVGFWSQTPLGNVLGAQDMWIPKGTTRKMILGSGCVQKESSEMVMSIDNTVAYVELWTKEHKSDKRERPVADIFVAIYLRLSRSGPNKKVLQLENIHGYATDVQYIVLRNSRSIIVSWSVANEGVSLVHCYHLSSDYQVVASITKMENVGHYVSSLHNIEDCDNLILGCGDFKVTLWNVEHGYVVATIDLIEIQPQPRTIWAKCDRGFLFTLQHFNDGVLQLIAINSFDSTWKRLQTYKPEFDYENLLGVCMENGLLVAFYDTGVSCWSAQTGVPVLEDTCEDSGVFLPFGKYVVVVLNNQVHVRHALEYLVTICPMEDS